MAGHTFIRMRSTQRIVDNHTRRTLEAGERIRIDAGRAGWAGYVSPQIADELVNTGAAGYEDAPGVPAASATPSPAQQPEPQGGSDAPPTTARKKEQPRSRLLTGENAGLGKQ